MNISNRPFYKSHRADKTTGIDMPKETQINTKTVSIEKPWSWISLMFSAFYFITLFYTPFELIHTIKVFVIYFIFLGLYARLQSCNPYEVKWLIICITGLGFLGVAVNPTANVFFGYATFYSGFYFSKPKASAYSITIITCLFLSAIIFNQFEVYNILPGLIPAISLAFLGAIIQQTILHKEKETQNEEEKAHLVAMAERERIARDLHDTLGHTLSSISLKAQLAKKLGDSGDMESALKEIHQVSIIASSGLSEVRSVVSDYKETGINDRLAMLKQKLTDSGFTTEIKAKFPPLPVKIEAALILMISESVTNILRHSKGNKANISISVSNSQLIIKVHDNGNVEHLNCGHGLTGIKERLEDLGGHMKTSIEQGFTLFLYIHLPTNK